MSETAVSQIPQLIGGSFALNLDTFQEIANLPDVLPALAVVLLAGVSLGIGQIIVLFVNRVKPGRFLLSQVVNALLFTAGFLFLVFSTWLVCQLPRTVNVPFPTLVKVLGFSYAPLLFSFLGAMPYLGVPILNILSVWRLLAMVVGFASVSGLGASGAVSYVAVGWFTLQILENTLGQPIVRFCKNLADRAAGVELARGRSAIRERVQSDLFVASTPMGTAPVTPAVTTPTMAEVAAQTSADIQEFVQAANRSHSESAQTVARTIREAKSQPGHNRSFQSQVIPTSSTADTMAQLEQKTHSVPRLVQLGLGLVGMVIVFILIWTLLKPIRNNVFGWFETLPGLFRLIFNLIWFGVVAFVFAAILAPLETLGWWAGLYGDEVDTSAATGQSFVAAVEIPESEFSRYIVYLDGIGQSGETYTPDVEEFLDTLEPALPEDMKLVRGLMMYSVLNQPLDEDRPLAFLWRTADKMRFANPTALLGILLNLRNVFIVAVSADKRYGPIYNQGIAQVLHDGLVEEGYLPGSGAPVTLIGYSGGGEMSVAAAPYLKRAMGAPIEVISLGGVMSANNNFLKLEHLYHCVGEKDGVERLGPTMFPGRWKIFPLSFWNRAKRKGKITIFSLGPVGHQVPGGMMDPEAFLPDGRSNLQQTIEVILAILEGKLLTPEQSVPRKPSNYSRYVQAEFNKPVFYPIHQTVDLSCYRPIGEWMGRLILPKQEERQQVKGIWLEVHHAPVAHQDLIGQVVKLRWVSEPRLRQLLAAARRDVHFSVDAEYSSKYGGLVHPDRLNHWQQVGPLESLAGSHPVDDITVMLPEEVVVESAAETILRIQSQPIQITGRYYAVVQFIEPIAATDQFRVRHFNPDSRQFDGIEAIVRMPQVIADMNGCFPSTSQDIEKVGLNEHGWYIYGAKDRVGQFIVQSLAPRALLTLKPQEVIFGSKAGFKYVRQRAWADIAEQKGKISSVLIAPENTAPDSNIAAAVNEWQAGDRALVLHTYGGIGGKKKEPAAATPIFFGHFAYGVAEVVREPLTHELRFDTKYYQVYTHNTDGLVAGVLHWSRYLGDRQFGWVGVRPTCDLVVKLESFTGDYDVNGQTVSPLNAMLRQLEVMTCRYRIGDGTGGTYVGPANNCSQDSNRALFASIQSSRQYVQENPQVAHALINASVNQEQRLRQLSQLGRNLENKLETFGSPRSDWEQNEYNLGTTLEDQPLRNLWAGLGSWRTMFPRLASETIVKTFLNCGATVWVLRTNQIGGVDPDIEPIAPTRI
ncbi:MAG: Yip1 family protein [Microcoleaceae cyanobacterium]